ncbi:hypothetical protein DHD08_15480 [Arenibacter sp. H213]|nr:hypothetical protein [Arenibacter sp. H213]
MFDSKEGGRVILGYKVAYNCMVLFKDYLHSSLLIAWKLYPKSLLFHCLNTGEINRRNKIDILKKNLLIGHQLPKEELTRD